jgi:cell division protein FtsX
MFYGVVGAFFAWIISYANLWYFTPSLSGYIGTELSLLPVNPYFMLAILLGNLLVACIIGSLGAYSAVRRYLKI